MSRHGHLACAASALALLAVLAGRPARADYTPLWAEGGVPAAPAPGYYQADLRALPDGQGGVFLVWAEYTEYNAAMGWIGSNIRAQHLGPDGAPLWGQGGITVCAAAGDQQTPVLISDGAGGIVVAWVDRRAGPDDIYAQRINSAGAPLWTADGVALCTALNIQQNPVLCTDGAGGAVVAWEDYRASIGTTSNSDIYAQRVRADGTTAWTANGEAIATSRTTVEFWPRVAPDGSGGALVAWTDAGTADNMAEIKARHVAADGKAGTEVGIGSAPNDQILNSVAPDGTGGYLLAWWDYRNSTTNADVYVQRLDASLGAQWGASGKALAEQPFDEYEPLLVPDGQGGATAVYEATGNGVDVLAAKIAADGSVSWTGKPLSTAPGDQVLPAAAPDGSGGVYVAWEDHSQQATEPDVYAQELSSSGAPRWAANGVPVAASSYYEQAPIIAVSDNAGGAIVAWEDWRDISGGQVYAQRFRDGSTGTDTTPPLTPTVTDDGAITADATLLHATWSSSDPESGIAEYRYAVGTTPGGTDIVPFTSAGTNTSATITGLNLADGTYYIAVQARNGAGLTSATGVSDGITVDTTAPSAAFLQPGEGAYVRGSVGVTGTAADANFQQAVLAWGAGASPTGYTGIATLSAPVTGGPLGTWDLAGLGTGTYTLRLTVTDKAGHTQAVLRSVRVVMPGDVDGDAHVTMADAMLLLQAASGLSSADPLQVAAGDVVPATSGQPLGYGDGSIQMADALRVLRAANSLDTLP